VKEGPVSPEDAPIVPPPLKRTLKKKGTLSIATTPATRDHESAIAVSVFVCDNPYPSSPQAYAWMLAAECWLDGRSSI
jgi:hypothetical protein